MKQRKSKIPCSWILLLMVSLCLLTGCSVQSSSDPYPYSPSDFKKPLKELLQQIEQYNIVFLSFSGCRGGGEYMPKAFDYYQKLNSIASDDELKKIAKCSNPTIRSYGILSLLEGKKADPFQLASEHLFDTAKIFDDYSNQKWSVISFLLHHTYEWKSKEDRNKIERILLENRPYELASYLAVGQDRYIDTFPGFYKIVKSMAIDESEVRSDETVSFYWKMCAINRLATYQKKEDILLLDTLLDYSINMGNGHFFPAYAIKNFPAPEFEHLYLDTSLKWYRNFNFLRVMDYMPYSYDEHNGMIDYVDLVLNHRSAKSARLLEKILEYSPYHFGGVGGYDRLKYYQEDRLYKHITLSIRLKPCPFYSHLIKKTEKYLTPDLIRDLAEKKDYLLNEGTKPISDTPPNTKPFKAYWSQ